MALAIKVENISKAYRLGEIGTGTLSRDIERWIAKLRGKEDPFLKIGEVNDRTSKGGSDVVWSLKDINFQIDEGDAVGIIGRNGAGKSTLLKLLSRVTSPTTGEIKVKGRIASLLEVGTGFHPDLTGRENIYLNGAILGMRKREIRSKFDEIVDFAGVERYVDTPVKRYSSGMYVRLAFAVAAHLESEILIVDEVLAVGDAEFQDKCLGKMKDVSRNQGRTVLFVSHDISAVRRLTNKSILLKNGNVELYAGTDKVISEYKRYLRGSSAINTKESLTKPFFKDIKIKTTEANVHAFGDRVDIEILVNSPQPVSSLEISFQIIDRDDNPIVYNWFSTSNQFKSIVTRKGDFLFTLTIPELRIYKGEYYFKFYLSDPRGKTLYDLVDHFYVFEVHMGMLLNEWGFQENACKYLERCLVTIDHQDN